MDYNIYDYKFCNNDHEHIYQNTPNNKSNYVRRRRWGVDNIKPTIFGQTLS